MAREFHFSDIIKSSKKISVPHRKTHNEINLVPDIKNEMIKALKLRNFIFFLCIVIAAASIGVTAVLGLTAGGQQLAMDSKKSAITDLSNKLKSYNDLNDFLTIREQLSSLSSISENKKVLSRTFNILAALIPSGADTITISELDIDLANETPSFSFDAQADAKKEPFIDYLVLESFKKSMDYMRYDYGRYVDKNGNEIPAYCIIESGSDGATFSDAERGIYALWLINGDGCNPSVAQDSNSSDSSKSSKSSTSGYDLEDYEGQSVVRIWRTPQYQDWYSKKYMNLDGAISGIEHFESACTSYSGSTSSDGAQPKWTSQNAECLLVPGGSEGITTSESSNGRDDSGQLVLRFHAVIAINPEVYRFANKHMLAVAPSGRRNVTDSYVQVQAMFGARANDCEKGDTACATIDKGDK